jgi:hypothetical protein
MTVDTLRDRGAANAPEIDQAAELEARRQALAQDRARFTQLEPQGQQLLAIFTRANFALGIRDLRAALNSRSGKALEQAIADWREQADNFASFGLVAVAGAPPRLHRQAELDEAADALRKERAGLAAFEAQPYGLADVQRRAGQRLLMDATIGEIERLITRLQAAAQ